MVNETTGLLISDIVKAFASLPGFTTIMRILQTAGILVIAYVLFLFIKGILQYKRFSKIKDMGRTLENIDQTLVRIEKKITSSAKQKVKK